MSVELTRLFQFLFYLTRDPIKPVQNNKSFFFKNKHKKIDIFSANVVYFFHGFWFKAESNFAI